MYLQTAQPKTVAQFIGRLREIEKIELRAAAESEARLEYMLRANFASDMITLDVLKEAAQQVKTQYVEAGRGETFGQTWVI